jgi:acetyl-CoA synthetase
MSSAAPSNIQSVLQETRVFPPPHPADLGMPRWHIDSIEKYRALHKQSIDDPSGFWEAQARTLHWTKPWMRVLDWAPPDAKWFLHGQLNACDNCVDRQVKSGHADDVAIVWEGEPIHHNGPEIRRLTYKDLQRETAKFANVLKRLGVNKGDVVTIYMPMIPELAIAMLACARIGAAHSIIFGGFAPHAIVERVIDAKSKVIVTADGGYRRGEIVPLKKNVDEACDILAAQKRPVESVIVVQRTSHRVSVHPTRDHWWHEHMAKASDLCPCVPMDSEDMLFLLYTSGSTGKPKGILHTTGGYLVYTTMTARLVFNLVPDSGQLFWCTADIGWVTGHSYVIYGVLPNRVPTLMYEGAPNAPAPDRFWDIIQRHKVTQLYTAPTAIRTFMKWGDDWPRKHDLSSLKVLGTVGEPINPEAWMWYRNIIGRGRCPIVDTYWQTETGGHVITPLPGAIPTKPGSCTLPMLGIDAAVVNEQGQEMPADTGGLLVTRRPWPGMLRGIHGDRNRYIQSYWSRVKGPDQDGNTVPYYFSADGARRDQDGFFWIMGRVDDVINVSGHRLGTMEVESALVSHPAVAEAAVVGMPHEIKGTGICAFVTLKPAWLKANPQVKPDDAFKTTLAAHVAKEIGGLARPDQVRFAEMLPKTRSGKIMRRLLRDIAAGVEKISQDTTTLEDYSVLAKLKESEEG